ncbi:MAG: cobalamin biosynthesis protein CobD, partial [Lachnospiraceae bacterium]|nr:cobalamin biosynthesis protein CobD [Lachnospiraceae bacterium]
ESVLTCYILAARSLYDESMKVCRDIERGDTDAARHDLSMIVGRDTDRLDESGMIRAAVETVAENTSDGVLAPLLYTALGGPVLGLAYKAVNTMDSMLGYHNDRYEYFGRTAAKADDVFNYVPSRISAWLIIISSGILGIISHEYSASGAYRIWRRDRRNHLSPNSAQTESACAGSLMIRLGGTSFYHGVLVEKPVIGDDVRQIRTVHIRYANRLMFTSESIMLIVTVALFLIAWKRL